MKTFLNSCLLAIFLISTGSVAYSFAKNMLEEPANITLLSHDRRVYQGETISVEYKVRPNWSGCRVLVERFLLNEQAAKTITVPLTTTFATLSDYPFETSIQLKIPDELPPGYYKYQTRISYTCNIAHVLFKPTIQLGPSFFIRVLDKNTPHPYPNGPKQEEPLARKIP